MVSSRCSERDEIFEAINGRKYVASGGKRLNNLPDGRNVQEKMPFISKYKFNLACENSRYKGYTTEKIVEAWAGGCIPVYWGNPAVSLEFNKDSYIDCSDFSSISELIDYLFELEYDYARLEKMLKTPILPGDDSRNSLEKFLLDIFSQDKEKAYRRQKKYSKYF